MEQRSDVVLITCTHHVKKESEINIFILGDYSHIKVFELKINKTEKTLKNLTTFIVAKHS